MKLHHISSLHHFFPCSPRHPRRRQRKDTVVLDETGVKNLRIETVEAEETDFEETIFALGRIEDIPRAPRGAQQPHRRPRHRTVKPTKATRSKKDQMLVRVESRQPGDPPPVIELKAPIGGLVVQSDIRLGEPVEPDKELLEITDLTEV